MSSLLFCSFKFSINLVIVIWPWNATLNNIAAFDLLFLVRISYACWVRWLHSLAMPFQCLRLRQQVSHLSMYFIQNSSLGRTYKVRDVHLWHYSDPHLRRCNIIHSITRVHLRASEIVNHVKYKTLTGILLEKQNWMFRPALFLEKELGSSACYDHRIRSLYMHMASLEKSCLNRCTRENIFFILLGGGR